MKCDLLVKGRYILPMDEKLSIIENGAVLITGNKIVDLGKASTLETKHSTKEILDSGNSIIMPGLINTHTHAAMSYLRGLADDLPLNEWLEKHIWPVEAKVFSPKYVGKASRLAILEMVKAGTTMFSNMSFFEEVTGRVAQQAGIRALVAGGILNFPTPSAKTPVEALDNSEKQIKEFQNFELVKVAVAPHSIYTCDKEILLKANELANKYDARIHIHISETKKEVDDSNNEHGMSPVKYLDKLALLSDRVMAAHSVWLDDDDLGIFKNRDVKVSHNPISNLKLASGVAAIPKMLEKGIVVGLGTDGAASNNTLDLFTEMRTAALMHKGYNLDPTVVNSQTVVKMVTINGARVLGIEDKIGSLEVGKRADIITINLDKPHLTPIYDPYSHLVYCANGSDVANVIINGIIIMKDRIVKTIDEEKVLRQAKDFKVK